MTIEFDTWPSEAVERLGTLARELAADGLERRTRRQVLARVASAYERSEIEPALLADHVDRQATTAEGMPSRPLGVRSAAVGSGTAAQSFAACVDHQGSLWWSLIGPMGPVDWQVVDVRGLDLVAIAATTSVSPSEGRAFRELFGITAEGRPWHAWQMAGGQWEEDEPEARWELQPDCPSDLISIAAASGGPNHVEVFVANAYGEVYHRWWNRWHDDATGAWRQEWSEWSNSPWPEDVQIRDLSFTTELDGSTPWRYQVFAIDEDGQPWHVDFVGEEGRWWGAPILLPAPPTPLQSITGACRTSGHLEVFGAAHDGQRYSTWSGNWGTDWSEWHRWHDDVPVLAQADGNTFDRDAHDAIHHQLIIDQVGGLSYSRYRDADERWRGPFPVVWSARMKKPSRMLARAVAEEFQLDLALEEVRVFESSYGRPKAELANGGARMFLGSLDVGWPRQERLEALFPIVNRLAETLEESAPTARLVRYLGAPGDRWIIERADRRFFVREYVTGRPPDLARDVARLAAAAAELHIAAVGQDTSDWLRDTATGELVHFALPCLERLAEPARFSTVEPALRLIADERVDRIDALPRTLTHNDLQPKNVMIDSEGHVLILDTEGMTSRSRLFDLYFFLLGDDHGVKLGDWAHFETAVRTYAEAGGILSAEEIFLLPDVLAVKAAGVAAWAIETVQEAPAQQRGVLRDIHEVALGVISFVDRERGRIREVVQQ